MKVSTFEQRRLARATWPIRAVPLGQEDLVDARDASTVDERIAFDKSDEPVHAVIAVDAARDRVLVVTVYPPDSRKWSDDYKTRR